MLVIVCEWCHPITFYYFRQLDGEQFYIDFPEILDAKDARRDIVKLYQAGAKKLFSTLLRRMNKRVSAITSALLT
jgi:hypothetical protein